MATARPRFGPADHGREIAIDEYWEAEKQAGYRYELAQGVLEVSEIPDDLHWQVVHNLHEMFSQYRQQFPGSILRIGHASDVCLVIPELRIVRHPDLALLLPGAPLDVNQRKQPMPAVEVFSPGDEAIRRDGIDKRNDYFAMGLLEYWMVVPEMRQVVVVFRREFWGAQYGEERVFRDDEVIASELLPGFGGTVAGLWADLDDEA